jgi:SOS-response transcriptional repressor LexA
MRKSRSKSNFPPKPEWAKNVSDLRQRLNLSQSAFGGRLHVSAMAISRWERGNQEPAASGYIELGNLAGGSVCWYFWARAGLQIEDLMRAMPKFGKERRLASAFKIQQVRAGSGPKTSKSPEVVAIPVLKIVAASHGEKGDSSAILHDGAVESVIAAPKEWCPNPASTNCLRVRGNSMAPLIHDGYILAVDSSQSDPSKLNGKVVIAWHRDMGLTVSRLRHYDHTSVLQPENREYESIVLDNKHKWKISAKVLWWIGQAP